jgi:hypothetical protein
MPIMLSSFLLFYIFGGRGEFYYASSIPLVDIPCRLVKMIRKSFETWEGSKNVRAS